MTDEKAGSGTVSNLDDARTTRANDQVEPNFKGDAPAASGATKRGGRKRAAGSKKATGKAPAKKAATKKASASASGGGVVRSKSTVSKEGTQKDTFTGETLPVTAFPTVRQKDGSYVRGTVARKNLEAWRAAKKADREKAKAAKATAKATTKAAPAKASGGRKRAAKKA